MLQCRGSARISGSRPNRRSSPSRLLARRLPHPWSALVARDLPIRRSSLASLARSSTHHFPPLCVELSRTFNPARYRRRSRDGRGNSRQTRRKMPRPCALLSPRTYKDSIFRAQKRRHGLCTSSREPLKPMSGRCQMTDDWWAEIDGEILDCLRAGGPMSPAAIGCRIGVSEASATSILSMLARQGQVRVCLVELSDACRRSGQTAEAPSSEEVAESSILEGQ